jgi:hypothetical protein
MADTDETGDGGTEEYSETESVDDLLGESDDIFETVGEELAEE